MNHYKKCTGLKDVEIREKLMPAHDVWLDANEAKKLGLCDKVQDMKMK
jgi:ATP-dependent protease ClpP protease subunit